MVFILLSTWMNGKYLIKHHCLKKKNFIKDCKDADYMHAKRVYKDFEIKSSGKYHNLYLKSDILLSAD